MKHLFRSTGRFSAALFALALFDCTTTPDLSGWAQNSAELAGAIGGENKSVSERIQADVTLAKIGDAQGWQMSAHATADWEGFLKQYNEATVVINRSLDTMTQYANALSELAAKGETGRGAGQSIKTSLESILKTVGEAYPLAGPAEAAFEEIADIVTKVQAQDSLAEAMERLQPAVDKLAGLIRDYARAQKQILVNVNSFEHTLYIEEAGLAAIWYENNHGYAETRRIFRQGSNPSQSAAYASLLKTVQPQYEAHRQALAASDKWFGDRASALAQIESAAEQWRKSHDDARDRLVSCGGMRSLHASCGNFTAANLKLAAERIRNIVQPPPAAPAAPVAPATPAAGGNPH